MRTNGRKVNFDHTHVGNKDRYIDERSGRPSLATLEERSKVRADRRQRFQEAFLRRQTESLRAHEYEGWHNLGNPDLPSYKHKQEIQEAVNDNQVTIIVGETGSGKSTQIPQFLLEAGYDDIVMTQPRIPAANGVADRIQEELTLFGGVSSHEASQNVSIHTSELNTTYGKDSGVRVVTDGLRLAQAYGANGETADEVLIIDEVHEWNTNIEVLVATAKQMISENPNMRLVIMSATMDAEGLSNYFADAVGGIPPIIEIQGRTFPVEKIERPDSTIIEQIESSVDADGDILVFVPGVGEVKRTVAEVQKMLVGTEYEDALVLPLYADQSRRDQDMIYIDQPDRKKIVVATNIAQTSITIPGITTVIDAGLERYEDFDEEGSLGLQLAVSSQDTCMQRAGRAGRVEPGQYILTRLDENSEYTSFISRDKETKPEILRSYLARSVLRTAVGGRDFEKLDLFHTVESRQVREARDLLHSLGALDVVGDDDDAVTEAGVYMNRFALKMPLARMMYEAHGKSENIRRSMAAIVASIEAGNLQSFTKDSEKKWEGLTSGEKDSDLVAQLNIFSEIFNRGFTSPHEDDLKFNEFINEYELNGRRVRRALKQYSSHAQRADVPGEVAFQEFEPLTQAELDEVYQCIYAGMTDTVYRRTGKEGREPVYQRIGSPTKTPRFVSNRSVVDKPTEMLVGSSYYHEYYQDGEKRTRSVVEGVTKVKRPIDLAASALKRHVSERPAGFKWRDGQLKQVNELHLYDHSLGLTEERAPGYNEQVEREMVRAIMEHSRQLPTVSKILDLKAATEEVAQKDRLQEIVPMTQEDVIEIVRSRIRAGQYDTIWDVENDLMVHDNIHSKFNLEEAIDIEDLERVARESPDSVDVYGGAIDLVYKSGQPRAVGDTSFIDRDVYLDDGREVLFPVVVSKRNERKSVRYVSGSKLNNN